MMVETNFASDSPRSRSPMTEPPSPPLGAAASQQQQHQSRVLSYAAEHCLYAYNITGENLSGKGGHKATVEPAPSLLNSSDSINKRTTTTTSYSTSLRQQGSSSPALKRTRGDANNHHSSNSQNPHQEPGSNSSVASSSPTSLFTIDSILAPRPYSDYVSQASGRLFAQQGQQQEPSSIDGNARINAAVHPLHQQLHHLAFTTSADFFGKIYYCVCIHYTSIIIYV